MKTWDSEWEALWHVVHNTHFRDISSQLDVLLKKFLKSNAGSILQKEVEKQRYPFCVNEHLSDRKSGKKRPVLYIKDLSTYHSPMMKSDYDGIKLGASDIRDVFFRQTWISPTMPVKV